MVTQRCSARVRACRASVCDTSPRVSSSARKDSPPCAVRRCGTSARPYAFTRVCWGSVIHELRHRLDLESRELVRWAWPGRPRHPPPLAPTAGASSASTIAPLILSHRPPALSLPSPPQRAFLRRKAPLCAPAASPRPCPHSRHGRAGGSFARIRINCCQTSCARTTRPGTCVSCAVTENKILGSLG